MKLYTEKRSDLEEQQLHLNVGLQKIKETVEQVEELQKSLALKSQELVAKNAAANSKLKQMVRRLAEDNVGWEPGGHEFIIKNNI